MSTTPRGRSPTRSSRRCARSRSRSSSSRAGAPRISPSSGSRPSSRSVRRRPSSSARRRTSSRRPSAALACRGSSVRRSMDEAVRAAAEIAREQRTRVAVGAEQAPATVLLSPAAASFDMFTDYEARGAAFKAAVARIGAEPSSRRVESMSEALRFPWGNERPPRPGRETPPTPAKKPSTPSPRRESRTQGRPVSRKASRSAVTRRSSLTAGSVLARPRALGTGWSGGLSPGGATARPDTGSLRPTRPRDRSRPRRRSRHRGTAARAPRARLPA